MWSESLEKFKTTKMNVFFLYIYINMARNKMLMFSKTNTCIVKLFSFVSVIVPEVHIFTFCYPCKVRNVLFHCLYNFQNWIFRRDSQRLKITFLAVGLCVCHQPNSKTNNTRKSKFGILISSSMKMLLNTFYEVRTNGLCIGNFKRIRIYYGGRRLQ